MSSPMRGAGRPRASSRETIAEAACELFLEQGFEQTQIAEIAQRAGVSRSSFFNYFGSKSDLFWAGLDERIAEAELALQARDDIGDEDAVAAALLRIAEGLRPDALAVAITNADAMGIRAELERERALRQWRLQRAVAARLRDLAPSPSPIAAEVRAAGYGAAVLAAVWAWADRTSPAFALAALLDEALRVAQQGVTQEPRHPLAPAALA